MRDPVKKAAKKKRNAATRKIRRRAARKAGINDMKIVNVPDHLRDQIRDLAKWMIADSKGGRDE